MNPKSYLEILRYGTFLDLKAGSIELSMVSQKRNQFRIGFDYQMMSSPNQLRIHQARQDANTASQFNNAVISSQKSPNQFSFTCLVLSKHKRRTIISICQVNWNLKSTSIDTVGGTCQIKNEPNKGSNEAA